MGVIFIQLWNMYMKMLEEQVEKSIFSKPAKQLSDNHF